MLRNEANKQIKENQPDCRKKILKSFKGKPKKFYGYMQRLRTVKTRWQRVGTHCRNNLDFEAPSTNAFKNWLDKYWTESDMGI